VVLATVLPHIYVVWLGSATELDRHALAIAVSLRIALWLMAAYALDALLVASPASRPEPDERDRAADTTASGELRTASTSS
jgi:hypothetical protein